MDLLGRIWDSLDARIGGPLSFRFVLQPLVATVLAVRAGVQDARAGRPPYFWTMLTDTAHRRELLRQGWKAVVKVFVVAAVIDLIYQVKVFRWVHPGQLLIIAFLLACVPYVLVRGPINRITAARDRRRRP